MTKVIDDLTNRTFGRLTVLCQAEEDYVDRKGNHYAQWHCVCSCSKRIIVRGQSLKSGNTKSCGCLNREIVAKQNKERLSKKNIFDLSNDYGICYSPNKDWFCYFDKEDYELIKPYYWIMQEGYIITHFMDKKIRYTIQMHRLILGLKKYENGGIVVDHKNGITYDNRKNNLRKCTISQNQFNVIKRKDNTSGVKGVSYYKTRNTWRARITVNGKIICLGYFENFEDAVKARKEAEEKYFGEFSYDNSRGNKEEGSEFWT